MVTTERTENSREEPDELLIDEGTSLRARKDTPSLVLSFYLPQFRHNQIIVRDTVHYDSVQLIFRRLLLHTPNELYLKGRVMTLTQRDQLLADPLYRFYLNQRPVRVADIENKGLKVTFSELPVVPRINPRRLLTYPHGVEGLASKVGYKLGYYNAKDVFNTPDDPHSYKATHLFAGVNRITLGSDTFTFGELMRVIDDLSRQLRRI